MSRVFLVALGESAIANFCGEGLPAFGHLGAGQVVGADGARYFHYCERAEQGGSVPAPVPVQRGTI